METELSLAELDAFDPHYTERDGKRYYCCPLGGICSGKPRDKSHQKLTVWMDSGGWYCNRCKRGENCKLKEWWTDRPKPTRKERTAAFVQRVTTPPPPPTPVAPENEEWRKHLQHLQPLEGTPGETYLAQRGIPLDLAKAAGVKWHARLFRRPAVMFPIRSRDGVLVGAQGRHTDGRDDPKAHDCGKKSNGVFITPGAWDAECLILVEAPIDALSLAACGYPAIATLGCKFPDWVPRACAFGSVYLGTDADTAGDDAAVKWATLLQPMGALVRRLRPEGFKDWNQWLVEDPAGMLRFLATHIQPDALPVTAVPATTHHAIQQQADALGERMRFLGQLAPTWDDARWIQERDDLSRRIDELHAAIDAAGVTLADLGWTRDHPGGEWSRLGQEPERHMTEADRLLRGLWEAEAALYAAHPGCQPNPQRVAALSATVDAAAASNDLPALRAVHGAYRDVLAVAAPGTDTVPFSLTG